METNDHKMESKKEVVKEKVKKIESKKEVVKEKVKKMESKKEVVKEKLKKMESKKEVVKEKVKEKVRKVYNCSECRYSTFCKSNFNKHCKIHNKADTQKTPGLVCDRCGRKYATKFGLELHIKTKHIEIFKHICDVCGKGFNQSVQYKLHLSSHVDVLENTCPICNAEFCVESSLRRHMRICKERDISTSEICKEKDTSTSENCKEKDMSTSENCKEKDISTSENCKVKDISTSENCQEKSTSTSEDVSADGRHICTECHSSYATKCGLQAHIKGMHTGAKFECNMCEKIFRWRSSLKAHLKCAHRYTAPLSVKTAQSTLSSNKRKIDDLEEDQAVNNHIVFPQPNAPPLGNNQPPRKCHVEEGFSWWTCAMYGMPYEKSKPQARPNEGN